MPFLSCYVDDRTFATLTACSAALGRSVEDLAEAAIAETALSAERPAMATAAGAPLCKDRQPRVRPDGGCLACEADQGEACRERRSQP